MANSVAMFNAGQAAWDAPLDARLAFVRRTYLHLSAAVAMLVAVSWALFQAGFGERLARWVGGSGTMGLLLFIGGMVAVSFVSTALAVRSRSTPLQYLGLSLYSVAQAVFIAPLLFIAVRAFPEARLLETAAGLTLLVFGGLSAYVLMTKKDLTFLGPVLGIASLVVLGVIVASLIFGFSLGLWYTGAMILFAAGAILYETSAIVHQYRTDQYVAAALGLFASVVMLFVQILSLLMQLQGRSRE